MMKKYRILGYAHNNPYFIFARNKKEAVKECNTGRKTARITTYDLMEETKYQLMMR